MLCDTRIQTWALSPAKHALLTTESLSYLPSYWQHFKNKNEQNDPWRMSSSYLSYHSEGFEQDSSHGERFYLNKKTFSPFEPHCLYWVLYHLHKPVTCFMWIICIGNFFFLYLPHPSHCCYLEQEVIQCNVMYKCLSANVLPCGCELLECCPDVFLPQFSLF